jgi:hypothetical protein
MNTQTSIDVNVSAETVLAEFAKSVTQDYERLKVLLESA